MALVKREFQNIECDCCGQLLDEETWWDSQEALPAILEECGWKQLCGRHYCEECWNRDDDDTIVTKDGRRWDDSGLEVVEVTPEQRMMNAVFGKDETGDDLPPVPGEDEAVRRMSEKWDELLEKNRPKMELAEKEITINGMRFQAERLHPNYRGEYDCRCEECIFDKSWVDFGDEEPCRKA